MKKWLLSGTSILIALMLTINTSANELATINVETTTDYNRSVIVSELANSLLTAGGNFDKLPFVFTSECEAEIKRTVGVANASSILEIVIDCVNVDYSSDEDFVMFGNIKVSADNGKNNIYLMELHVNAEGLIYGFNIWSY